MANKLPMTIQRSLAFLPLELDTEAVLNAKATTDWRVQMWEKLIPQIPKYFWLGKGYGISAQDLEQNMEGMAAGTDASDSSAMVGDYHNGPLSVIISFGIFGAIGFLWLAGAGLNVLLKNYKYGPPELLIANRFVNGGRKVRRGHECDVAVQKCGIFINLKHVLQYGKLGRDSQESVGGRGESAGDSPGDGDALENLEEDSGA